MSTDTAAGIALEVAPQRKLPRYKLAVPLDLRVLRSGVPDRIPGRTLEIGEGGIGVVVASQLLLGESVRVEFLLPHMTTPVRATAVVRYQRERCFGLQFLRLPVEQQSIIRYWTRREGEVRLGSGRADAVPQSSAIEEQPIQPEPVVESEIPESPRGSAWIRRIAAFAVPILVIAGSLGWWRWQQGWTQLEAPVLANELLTVKPQLTVPADVMEQRVVHKVIPDYPESARQAGVQGTVVLNAVVGADGNVTQVTVVSGPEALARAAVAAVRWWRYEPYSVNDRALPVETTVRVDFRFAN